MAKIGNKIDAGGIDGNLESLRRDLEHDTTLGLAAVEIPVHGLDVIRHGRVDRKRLSEAVALLAEFEFDYTVHAPDPLNLMDQRAPDVHLSVFKASLEFAASIGARVLVYHAGRFIPEEAFAVAGEQLIPKKEARRFMEIERGLLGELADEYPDVLIGVENVRPFFCHSPYSYGEQMSLLQEQIEEIDRPNVRITLDLGHLYMGARFYRTDPVAAVERSRDWICHIHIHDNFGRASYYAEQQEVDQIPFGRGDSHMPVGWGEIPLDELLSACIPPYDGILMMELGTRYVAHIEESKRNLQALLQTIAAAPVN